MHSVITLKERPYVIYAIKIGIQPLHYICFTISELRKSFLSVQVHFFSGKFTKFGTLGQGHLVS